MSHSCLIDFIIQKWADFPSRTAFQYKSHADWATMHYETLLARIQHYGQYLTMLGVKRGEKVVFFPENTPDHIIAMLGIMFVGAVPCLLDGQLPLEALNDQLAVLQPRLAIGSALAHQKYASQHDIAFLPPQISSEYHVLKDIPSLLENNVALILLTSGTSGTYQIVCHSHQGIIAQIHRSTSLVPDEIARHLDTVFFLPYFHIYPLVNHLLPLLAHGGTCLLVADVHRRALAEGFRRSQPALIVVVPRILEVIQQGIQEQINTLPQFQRILTQAYLKLLKLTYPKSKKLLRWLSTPFRRQFGGALQVIFCGGATLDPETHQFIEMLIAPVYVGYGLTETAGACVSNTKDHTKLGTVGRALSGCMLKIDRPDHMEAGEICVQSDALMLGYLQDGKIVQACDREGWYHTGDLGKIDQEGYLTITDRIKDLIVTSDGKKVSPLMLENQYKHLPHIRELIVIDIKDAYTDAQNIVALVVPTDTFHKEMIEVALFQKASQLPHQYRLQTVYFVKEIFKTNTMKVHRQKNRDALMKTIQPQAPTETLESVKEKMPLGTWEILVQLVLIIKRVLNLPKEQVDVTKNLVQMGMDSIEFSDFYLLLLEQHPTKLSLEKLYALPLMTLAQSILDTKMENNSHHPTHPLTPRLDLSDYHISTLAKSHKPAKTILLTGATGFLGAFLLRDLMLHTQAHIVCLVRGANDDAARTRVIETSKKYLTLTWNDQFSNRLTVLSGDISKPTLGLQQDQYDLLSESVDTVIHSAANVNFLISFDALHEDNVSSIESLLHFSAHRKLKVIEHISTFSVLFGGKEKENILDEHETHAPPISSLGYTQSKWAAEQLLYQAKAAGFPVNIYRPAIITADTVNGLYNTNDLFMNMFLSCLQIKKYIRTDAPVYMMPVDLVSLSIVKLANRQSAGNIYHLFGTLPPITFSSLMKKVSKHYGRLTAVPKEAWFKAIIESTKAGKALALHRYLPLFMNDPDYCFLNDLLYLSNTKLAAEKTNEILLKEGIDVSALSQYQNILRKS